MVESVVLSDRSRAILRCIVEACAEPHAAAVGRPSAPGAARPADPADRPLRVPDEDGTGSADWPCDVAPPTRRELTPLRMQGLVAVRTDGDGHLLASPTPLGLEVAGRPGLPGAGAVDGAAVSRRI
ncbi:MAG: hypothetical protein F2817_06970, partial [Actinobacteria bacterium]|nr:hypothetical protein [Actinomycetota bacterium]